MFLAKIGKILQFFMGALIAHLGVGALLDYLGELQTLDCKVPGSIITLGPVLCP